jgi:hypothetical protein
MKAKHQSWLLIVFLVLTGILVVSLVARCASGSGPLGGRTRIVEQFDNGPILPGPDGRPRMQQGPSEGYLRVAEDASPPPGKSWRTINPKDLSEEERKRLP